MGTMTAGELELNDMKVGAWRELAPIREFRAALSKFLLEELPADVKWGEAGMTAACLLSTEFANEIWMHRRPDPHELLYAKRAGRLQEKFDELNEEYEQSKQGK